MAATPPGSGFGPENSLDNPGADLTYDNVQAPPDADGSLSQSDQIAFEHKKSITAIIRVSVIGLIVILLFVGLILFFVQGKSNTLLQTGNFNEIRLPLDDIATNDALLNAQGLKVRGQLEVDSFLTLSPSSQPKNPISGQLYFDEERKQMQYYDGTQFVLLQGGTGPTINNVSNISTGGTTQVTNVFNSGGGNTISFNGTSGTLAMFTGASTLGDSLVTQSGSSLQVGSTGATSVTVGSNAGASSTTIQGGTGNLALSTGDTSGVSGSISITTGDSSTTASGDITIDAGSGFIDGEVVSDKTFEAGLNNLTAWFGVTVAQSSVQAHTGTYSLAETGTGAFAGIIEDQNFPVTPVTAGHQYYFSNWVRAQTTSRTISIVVHWTGSSTTNTLTPTVDNNTAWTEITGTLTAPAGATGVYITITHSGATGEVHYFDDMTITDLSSASAVSSINIGKTNAKIVTIGNLNQVGATSIYGGSGINLNGGSAGINVTGGVLNFTGNAASSLTTTSGALTITSAASATWGIGTASSGVGGDLTLRAGRGGTDANNDGGDLFLQGGAANGTGAPGSVIVKPQTDTADIFQIQNNAGTAFLVADATNKRISVAGTSTSFASLSLDNAHFRSTQTTAPTIGTPTNCGTTPTAAITAGSTDSAGSLSITTGTGGTAASCDVTITFNQAYGASPKSIIVVGKVDAASAARQIYVSSASATTFTTSFGTSAGGANSTTYSFSYWVIE